MNETLKARDGHLYVVSEDCYSDEPVLVSRWYPLGTEDGERVKSRDREHMLEGSITEGVVSGVYTWRAANGISTIPMRLLNMGATVPDFTDEEPIPAPKCRVETRWMNGRWEKYLASRGWVVA